MKNILVIGSNGQLGSDLVRIFSQSYNVSSVNHDQLEITDKEKVTNFFKGKKFDFIVNTAAFHKLKECQKYPDKSFLVNAVGSYNLSKESYNIGATIVFISTDYVFDGEKDGYFEEDVALPINVYGASKLAGEFMTRIGNPNSYIIRTSALFGSQKSGKGYNFVTLMLERGQTNECLDVVNDLQFSPTYTLDLAYKLREVIEKSLPFGIYHITNGGTCSWYEFAKKIFELSNLHPKLKPISSINNKLDEGIKRPHNTVLINKRIEENGLKILRSWDDALLAYLQEIEKEGNIV